MRPWLALCPLLFSASAVAAQPAAEPALPRVDVQAAIGWQNLRNREADLSRNNWMNSIVFGDAAVGWYWTEHLRMQIDIGAGSTGHRNRVVDRSAGPRAAYQLVETEVSPATFAVSQQYQFFHNALFHPHVGAGLLVRREHVEERYSPVTVFDPITRQSTMLEPPRIEAETRTDAAALADVGFKLYLSQRAFFSSDVRFTFRRGVDGVLLRFGFGADF